METFGDLLAQCRASGHVAGLTPSELHLLEINLASMPLRDIRAMSTPVLRDLLKSFPISGGAATSGKGPKATRAFPNPLAIAVAIQRLLDSSSEQE